MLIHLSREKLAESFRRQAEVLNPGGLLFHTFWHGDTEEEFNGLRFVYYTRKTLTAILRDKFENIVFEKYTEMEDGDSFYIVLKLREN